MDNKAQANQLALQEYLKKRQEEQQNFADDQDNTETKHWLSQRDGQPVPESNELIKSRLEPQSLQNRFANIKSFLTAEPKVSSEENTPDESVDFLNQNKTAFQNQNIHPVLKDIADDRYDPDQIEEINQDMMSRPDYSNEDKDLIKQFQSLIEKRMGK